MDDKQLYNYIHDDDTVYNKSVLLYNAAIPTLPKPNKTGYIFVCWLTDSNKCFNMTTMPDYNITLTAKWDEIIVNSSSLSRQITGRYIVIITFSKANITKEEIREEMITIVEEGKYFEIKEEGDEIIVIIGYDDIEEAEKLEENIKNRYRGKAHCTITENNVANTIHLSIFLLSFLIIKQTIN